MRIQGKQYCMQSSLKPKYLLYHCWDLDLFLLFAQGSKIKGSQSSCLMMFRSILLTNCTWIVQNLLVSGFESLTCQKSKCCQALNLYVECHENEVQKVLAPNSQSFSKFPPQ